MSALPPKAAAAVGDRLGTAFFSYLADRSNLLGQDSKPELKDNEYRHMGRLAALGLFERADDQTFVPTKELREIEIERALRLLRRGTSGLL
jgi:hypothetical protein